MTDLPAPKARNPVRRALLAVLVLQMALAGLLFLLPAYWLSRERMPAEGLKLDQEMVIRPKK